VVKPEPEVACLDTRKPVGHHMVPLGLRGSGAALRLAGWRFPPQTNPFGVGELPHSVYIAVGSFCHGHGVAKRRGPKRRQWDELKWIESKLT